jgi:UDP-N-acetylmuramoyl-tripeptide--D-alanyl-D-alanine ligase
VNERTDDCPAPGPGEDDQSRGGAAEPPGHPWSLRNIAQMTRATVAGIAPEDWHLISPLVAAGVAIDSRVVRGGEVFIALPGARHDGHDFVADAFEAGAAAVLARRTWWSRRKAARAQGIHLLVDDPLVAMQEWAAALRQAVAPKVIAVTGSSGKTTTKEMILALLHNRGDVVGTTGNHNNEIGLPLTLLSVRSRTRVAVVEMGANHPGEIARLTAIARPDVAVLTCVGHAHAGLFGGRAGILAAKLEILTGLAPDGVLILPDDDPELEAVARQRWSGRILRFGRSEGADVRATATEFTLTGTRLTVADEERPLELRLLGEGAVRSALAALAVARVLGSPSADGSGLARVTPMPGRMDRRESRGVTWLLDMYNASPESTLANLDFFRQVPVQGRKVFIFGGMRELGEETEAQHKRVGGAAGFCDAGVFLGDEARIAAPEAQKAGEKQVLWCGEIREVVQFLRKYLRPGDAVYLKGARAAGLEQVAREMQVITATYGEGGL